MTNLKVLIINPPIRLHDKPRNLPHGLAILANVIRRDTGITPVFLDVNAHRYGKNELEDILKKTDFNIVLIGGIASVYKFMIEISDFIKEINPDSKIVAGGYVAMPIPNVLLENSKIDIICTGQGEITAVELLKKFQSSGLESDLSGIKGLCYKQEGNNRIVRTPDRPFIKNLDEDSAAPAYDLLPMDIYLSNLVSGIGRDTDMITIRGCPFRCSFCYQPWGHKPAAHSADFMIDIIKHLKENYAIDFISFQDDEFAADKKRMKEFCGKRNKYLPDVLWSCTGRANIIARNEEMVKLAKNSGCILLSCGFESGSPRMLKSMNKMQTVEDMEKSLKILRKYEMPVPASFIIGMPGEDEESCRETVDFCIRNNINLDSLMFATPYPGTELFEFALKTRRINNVHEFMMKVGDARDFLVNLTDSFSDERLVRKKKEMMEITRKHYDQYITFGETMRRMKKLFGSLMDRVKLDEKDLEHKAKHGGGLTF